MTQEPSAAAPASYRTVLCLAFAALLGAEPARTPSSQAQSRPVPVASPRSDGARHTPVRGATLRAAYIQEVQRSAGSHYRPEQSRADSVRLVNRRQGLRAELERGVLRVTPSTADRGAPAALRLLSYGCGAETAAALPVVAPGLRGARVEYERGLLVEWYVNGPLGIEQGFDLKAGPPCGGRGAGSEVSLNLEIDTEKGSTLRPELVPGGASGSTWLALRDEEGQVALAYTDFSALDASGRPLATRMSLSGRLLALHVETRGARYPIVVDPLLWAPRRGPIKLAAGDTQANDHMGASVVVSGDTAVIGVPGDDDPYKDVGSARVFRRNAMGNWEERALLSADPVLDGNGGQALGIGEVGDGSKWVVIGAPGTLNVTVLQGQDDTWNFVGGWSNFETFGSAVANSGARGIVGEPGPAGSEGRVFMLEHDPMIGSDIDNGHMIGDGVARHLGAAVALDGDLALAGAPDDPARGASAGAVYWFRRFGVLDWQRQGVFFGTDTAAGDRFGSALAISGNTAVVGVPARNGGRGAVYIFTHSAGVWTQQAQLAPTMLGPGDAFGTSVSLIGNRLLIGAPRTDLPGATDAGAVYAYSRSGVTWQEQSPRVTADTPLAGELFGSSVALDASGAFGIVGAPKNGPSESGAFYEIVFGKQGGDACGLGSECVSGSCSGTCQGRIYLCDATNVGKVCNAASLPCETDAVCAMGVSACPAKGFKVATTVCRPASGDCDVEETCSGSAGTCPADAIAADGSACAMGMCRKGQCISGVDLVMSGRALSQVTRREPFSLAIDVDNRGTSEASQIVARVALPDSAEVFDATGDGWSFQSDPAGILGMRDRLASGASAPFTVSVLPPVGASDFAISLNVSTAELEGSRADNAATISLHNDDPLFSSLGGGGFGCAAAPGADPRSTSALFALIGALYAGLLLRGMRRRNGSPCAAVQR